MSAHPVIPWLTAARRRWCYGVAAALHVLAVALGADARIASAVLGVAVALLAYTHVDDSGSQTVEQAYLQGRREGAQTLDQATPSDRPDGYGTRLDNGS